MLINVALGASETTILSELQKLVKKDELAKIMSSFLQWLALEAKNGQLIQLN